MKYRNVRTSTGPYGVQSVIVAELTRIGKWDSGGPEKSLIGENLAITETNKVV
jgi:hypothetical protein